MRKAVKLRTLTAEEETEIRRLAASRKEPHSLVQRAKLIVAMHDNPNLNATHAAIQVGFLGEQTGINWVRHFNAEGVAGLQDKPKVGRPPTHDQTVRSALIALARTKPESLGVSLQAVDVGTLANGLPGKKWRPSVGFHHLGMGRRGRFPLEETRELVPRRRES
jgi:transposase